MKLEFELPGRPVPKQRPRRVQMASGQHITYTPKETKRFESRIRAEAYIQAYKQKWPLQYAGPVRVVITLTFPDKRHGDADNYAKAILDGMQGQGGVIHDDRQVADLRVQIEQGKEGVGVLLEALNPLEMKEVIEL